MGLGVLVGVLSGGTGTGGQTWLDPVAWRLSGVLLSYCGPLP